MQSSAIIMAWFVYNTANRAGNGCRVGWILPGSRSRKIRLSR